MNSPYKRKFWTNSVVPLSVLRDIVSKLLLPDTTTKTSNMMSGTSRRHIPWYFTAWHLAHDIVSNTHSTSHDVLLPLPVSLYNPLLKPHPWQRTLRHEISAPYTAFMTLHPMTPYNIIPNTMNTHSLASRSIILIMWHLTSYNRPANVWSCKWKAGNYRKGKTTFDNYHCIYMRHDMEDFIHSRLSSKQARKQ